MGVIGHYILKAILCWRHLSGLLVEWVRIAPVLLRLAHVSQEGVLEMSAALIARHTLRTQEMICQREPHCCDSVNSQKERVPAERRGAGAWAISSGAQTNP